MSLIQNLQNSYCYEHPVSKFQVIETHISWVILTGHYVYKIKKPVNLGFLDFSTLEMRKFYCEEEIRLGKILAPEIYLETVAIYGTQEAPSLGNSQLQSTSMPIIDYAVKMHEFPKEALLTSLLSQNRLTATLIAQLAKCVADFHQATKVANSTFPFGSPEQVHTPVLQNFDQIQPLLQIPEDQRQLSDLKVWSCQQWEYYQTTFLKRKQQHFIRECHGDLHLANIIFYHGKILLLDCLEFNEAFRWTDTMADLAFLVMDLHDKGRPDLATLLINSYLSYTADYQGLSVLPYYLVYRAMVRAKVSLLRLAQPGITPQEAYQVQVDYKHFITIATHYTQLPPPTLVITHGLSGAGKTTQAQHWSKLQSAIHLRSDVIRKQLYGLPIDAQMHAPLYSHHYTPQATEQTYLELLRLTEYLLHAGFSVIVDASFLKRAQRTPFNSLAQRLKTPYHILHAQAPIEVLRQRIQKRQTEQDSSEAREDILNAQIHAIEPLTATEQNWVMEHI